MNRFLLVSFVSCVLIGGSSCRQATDSGLRHVRLAVGGQNQMVYLPTTLAQELGFYREEGIEAELQDFAGGAKALQAAVGGSADVVSGFYDHTIQMAAEGREPEPTGCCASSSPFQVQHSLDREDTYSEL